GLVVVEAEVRAEALQLVSGADPHRLEDEGHELGAGLDRGLEDDAAAAGEGALDGHRVGVAVFFDLEGERLRADGEARVLELADDDVPLEAVAAHRRVDARALALGAATAGPARAALVDVDLRA